MRKYIKISQMNPVNRSRIAELYKLVDELTTDIIALKVQAAQDAQDAADKKTVVITFTVPNTEEGATEPTVNVQVLKGDLTEAETGYTYDPSTNEKLPEGFTIKTTGDDKNTVITEIDGYEASFDEVNKVFKFNKKQETA